MKQKIIKIEQKRNVGQKMKVKKSGIAPEFKKLVKKVMDQHDDALRELAKL